MRICSPAARPRTSNGPSSLAPRTQPGSLELPPLPQNTKSRLWLSQSSFVVPPSPLKEGEETPTPVFGKMKGLGRTQPPLSLRGRSARAEQCATHTRRALQTGEKAPITELTGARAIHQTQPRAVQHNPATTGTALPVVRRWAWPESDGTGQADDRLPSFSFSLFIDLLPPPLLLPYSWRRQKGFPPCSVIHPCGHPSPSHKAKGRETGWAITRGGRHSRPGCEDPNRPPARARTPVFPLLFDSDSLNWTQDFPPIPTPPPPPLRRRRRVEAGEERERALAHV